MAASTTIHDLPDDMLHEIFGRVFADEPEVPSVVVTRPPEGAHLALRCVCRRWRDIADWVRLSTCWVWVEMSEPEDANAGVIRARHPAAFKRLVVMCGHTHVRLYTRHTTSVSQVAASLINNSADLRRALLSLDLRTCCLPTLLPAVNPVASCTDLTELRLHWKSHQSEPVVPSNALAPLSALQMLNLLVYTHSTGGEVVPTSALLAPLPALPDAPRLTAFGLNMMYNFVPIGSDAALGRLRRLILDNRGPLQDVMEAEDPFLLRTAFDAGTWQPSRLTGLQELEFLFGQVRGPGPTRAPLRPSRSRAGSEWAPLASQVTKLTVSSKITSDIWDYYTRPSTGIVAGLAELTALRWLCLGANFTRGEPSRFFREPVSIGSVRAPHLTCIESNCVSTPASVAQCPNLVDLYLVSVSGYPPLNLQSLVARSSLKALHLANGVASAPGELNLAELFVGGCGWPVLRSLVLRNIVLEWDARLLAGAPTAVEFAECARQLLPALGRVEIAEPRGRGAQPYPLHVEFVEASREHVVPALLGLNARGG